MTVTITVKCEGCSDWIQIQVPLASMSFEDKAGHRYFAVRQSAVKTILEGESWYPLDGNPDGYNCKVCEENPQWRAGT